ncbi:hypothetical protein PBI_BEAGLE_61 [Arthrobacter phage Beagle]|nr:hypothetical protein PBI_BEAGLE_61 [Arthrobacter phage Beagle]
MTELEECYCHVSPPCEYCVRESARTQAGGEDE